MGEIIGSAIILIAVVVLVGGGISFAVHQLRPEPHTVDHPRFRNHLAMARWIEAMLRDDKVTPTIQSGDIARAKRLLAEFYDERPERSAKSGLSKQPRGAGRRGST